MYHNPNRFTNYSNLPVIFNSFLVYTSPSIAIQLVIAFIYSIFIGNQHWCAITISNFALSLLPLERYWWLSIRFVNVCKTFRNQDALVLLKKNLEHVSYYYNSNPFLLLPEPSCTENSMYRRLAYSTYSSFFLDTFSIFYSRF